MTNRLLVELIEKCHENNSGNPPLVAPSFKFGVCVCARDYARVCTCDHEPLPNLLIFGIVFLLVTVHGSWCQILFEILGKFAVAFLRSYFSFVLIYSFTYATLRSMNSSTLPKASP